MILPAPENLRPWTKYPLTWTLLLLNVLIFVMMFSGAAEKDISSSVLRSENLQVSGKLYYEFLQALTPERLFQRPDWVLRVHRNSEDQLETLGAYALRDAEFLAVASKFPFRGDEIRIEKWKKDLHRFEENYFDQVIFRFGLHSFSDRPSVWLTYQFSHSGWLHLLSNMTFLVLISVAVEAVAGSAMLVLLYLFGGFAGGLAFLLLNSHGSIPMVGASASVSALMAFYCVFEPRRRIRYFYFITPLPNQYGMIYLPTFLIFPLFLLVDFASLLSTPQGLAGGVAYSAHIGGTLFGLATGALWRWWPRRVVLTKS